MPLAGNAMPSIGVFGHYGNRNLGDEAIIEALLLRLRAAFPAARLRLFSVHPADTRMRYGVEAFPIRQAGESQLRRASAAPAPAAQSSASQRQRLPRALRPLRRALGAIAQGAVDILREVAFLARSYGRVRDLDALIIAGSNQFLDNYGGPWGFPYTLLKWTVLCRLAGVRVYYLSVGAGPLDSALGKTLVRLCLPLASYVSFRDEGSRALVEGARLRRSSRVCPDLAHALPVAAATVRPPCGTRTKTTVGINPAPVFDARYWYHADQDRYRGYVTALASFADRLLEQGHALYFFPTHPKDVLVAQDVLAGMRRSADGQRAPPAIRQPQTVPELMQVIGEADVIVATRFHGTLLSLHAWKPVLAVCYHRKMRELMRGLGQEAYALDVENVQAGDLWERFKALEARAELERDRIRAAESARREALECQFAEVLPQLSAAAPAVQPN